MLEIAHSTDCERGWGVQSKACVLRVAVASGRDNGIGNALPLLLPPQTVFPEGGDCNAMWSSPLRR